MAFTRPQIVECLLRVQWPEEHASNRLVCRRRGGQHGFERFGVGPLVGHDFVQDLDAWCIAEFFELTSIKGDMLALVHFNSAQGGIGATYPID